MSKVSRGAIVMAAASVLTTAAAVQQKVIAQSSAQPPAARTAAIEFRAFGPDGQPVLDLAASDVTLRVDGRQRTLQSLELVRDDAADAAPAALPEPFATNVQTAVDTDVEADLQPAGPVTLSAMMTGVAAQDGGFVPRLQFDGDKGAFGYFEIYGVPKSATLAVRLEIAKSPDGPALVGDDVALAPGPADDVKVAFSGYAIDGMPPGDVVMRALISVDGQQTGRLLRTIRKVR
jgi:hypothetical protein